MPNRTLSEAERQQAMALVAEITGQIEKWADGDEELAFAYNRKISKELVIVERNSSSKRKRLKKKVWKTQGQKCPECKLDLELPYSIADRKDAMKGYVAENVEVIHAECDKQRQRRKSFG